MKLKFEFLFGIMNEMLFLIYFVLVLRSDEVVRVQNNNLSIPNWEDWDANKRNNTFMILT